jgi:hypothetical protein
MPYKGFVLLGCVGVANPYKIRSLRCLKPVLPTRHAYRRSRRLGQCRSPDLGPSSALAVDSQRHLGQRRPERHRHIAPFGPVPAPTRRTRCPEAGRR